MSGDLWARFLEPSPPTEIIKSKVIKPREKKRDHSQSSGAEIYAVKFQILGKVKGVLFRSNAKMEAERLGVEGYIKYGPKRSVIGEITGCEKKIALMKNWLRNVGSPFCQIQKARFSHPRLLKKNVYMGFYLGFLPKPIRPERVKKLPPLKVFSSKIKVLPPAPPTKGILRKKTH